MGNLTQKFCFSPDLSDGVYGDSKTKGLRLEVRGNGKYRRWVLRRAVNKKSYDVPLGSIRTVDLVRARAKASKLNSLSAADFLSFLNEQKAAKKGAGQKTNKQEVITFRKVVDLYIAWNLEVGNWQEYDKAHRIFVGRMKNHIFPHIGDKDFNEITEEDISKMMVPIWNKVETVNRCLRIVKNVFDWGKAKNLRTKDNPADRNGALKFLLPQTRSKTINRGALSVEQLPVFMAELYKHLKDGSSWQCAFLAVLTATRSKTAREAKWEQIDWENKEWIIPASQLKVSDNGALIVPLSDEVIGFLKSIKGDSKEGLIFPNREGKVMSDAMFSNVVARLEEYCGLKFNDEAQGLKLGKVVRATMHGIARATFRTWSQDDSLGNDKKFDARIAELCLHHKVKDGYNGAYERNESKIRRREMMNSWSKYCFCKIDD